MFFALLAAFAAGLWGTVLRPPAYEVRGELIARPAANMILVAHEPIGPLGMRAMELMAVFGRPEQLDAARLSPGDRIRMAVRRRDDEIHLIWVEKLQRR